ncbi:MAG: TetR family transcriptional regulator [Amycolatopsis sp.]|nr:TetR family transcriptional regulator [Amycolatopsis sp.]
MGLRERKKRAAREALSWAAVRLATERGLENVRVEEIAAEVGVSARTFNNYFPSKEAAVCSFGNERHTRIVEGLRSRPADEPLWESLIAVVAEQFSRHGGPDREFVSRVRLMMSTPSIMGEFLKSNVSAERRLADEIARRLGADAEVDLYPRLVAGVVGATSRIALDFWLHTEPGRPFLPMLTDALRQASAGLPVPDTFPAAPAAADPPLIPRESVC